MSRATAGTKPNCIISVYPLTREFKTQVAELAGADSIWLTMGELRALGALGMLRRLRSFAADRVFLPVEDDEGASLLPILKIVAGLIHARRVMVINAQGRQTPVNRTEIATSVYHLVRASMDATAKMRAAAKDVKRLLAQQRHDPKPTSARGALFLNANLWFGVKAGGSVGHISGVINGLMELGYPVTYASAGGRLLVRDEAAFLSVAPPLHYGMPSEYNHYRFHYEFLEQVKNRVFANDFGFIYQRLSICNFSGAVISRELNLPLVIEYNGSEAWIAKHWGRPLHQQQLAEQVEEVCLRHAHLIVTISDVLRDELLARGIPPNRIVTYPNCIDPETFNPDRFTKNETAELRRKHHISEDALVVTFIGTFGQWHGAPVLAAAAREILETHGTWAEANKLHFLFVGDGLKMREVRDALGPYVSSPRLTLAGLVPQVQAPLYLAASDILSSPHVPNADGSRFFGSPTKLFEYMAMGKPIIASDLDQIGEVLANSIRVDSLPDCATPSATDAPAMLTTPGSAREIVDSILFLAERPDWRVKLGANARRLALSRYTWRHHVQAILDQMAHLGFTPAAISKGGTQALSSPPSTISHQP